MGIRDIKQVFNLAADGAATCSKAFLKYERLGNPSQEWQFLEMSGNWADGSAFSIRSDGIPRNGILELAARATAEKLLQMKEPPK